MIAAGAFQPLHHQSKSTASVQQSSAKSFWPLVLSLQQSHHHIVVPGVVHESSFSFPSLLDKATFLVGPDGACVVRKHSYPYPVQSQMREGMFQDKTYGFTSKPFAQQFRIENANGHRRTAVMGIKVIQPYFPYQPTVNIYVPSIRISDQLLEPLTGSLSGQRPHVASANPEHFNDLGMVPQR
jgi:hypothetical protein